MLLEHLYSFFGILLGCSDVAKPGFPAYGGDKSMYEVHKFMALDAYQVQYFIEQVGLSAASFGVTTADVEAVGHAIQSMFGVKCAPKFSVAPGLPRALQSICIAVSERVRVPSVCIVLIELSERLSGIAERYLQRIRSIDEAGTGPCFFVTSSFVLGGSRQWIWDADSQCYERRSRTGRIAVVGWSCDRCWFCRDDDGVGQQL